ncbi:MAG: hypothetical protein HOQ10_10405 [Frateuria sp.]|nr:hypothetical protein [Frateuria sp.]NUR21817.1 hypothetical protein [Frateuria sp.]
MSCWPPILAPDPGRHRAVTQYVHPCKPGLVRIVKHGRRWRSLLDEREVGRHETAETAVQALRAQWPQARIPASLLLWRQLPEPRRIGQRAA